MSRTENVELTVLCLITDGDRILLQNRTKNDWQGYTLPGGHVEPGESFVDAVIREVKKETGLDIKNRCFFGRGASGVGGQQSSVGDTHGRGV
jgi:8-oxo-dGTP diphosphatase